MVNKNAAVFWKPSRVEGLAGVTLVTVRPDRVELETADGLVTVFFDELVEWPRPRWFWHAIRRLGLGSRFLVIGEHDWFHSPQDRFFRFRTHPPLVLYCCEEPVDLPYVETLFWKIREVFESGGFTTNDLG